MQISTDIVNGPKSNN